jgi:hypothetical protein
MYVTWAIDGGEWSALCPNHFYSWGKSHHYLLYWRLGRSKDTLDILGKRKISYLFWDSNPGSSSPY